MSYQHPSIRWLSDGQQMTGYYILDRIEFPINISEWPLLHGVLRDAGDSMEMICRKPSEDITDAWNGAIVAVSGTVRAHGEKLVLIAKSVSLAGVGPGDEVLEKVVPHAPINETGYALELNDYIESISDPYLYDICDAAFSTHSDWFLKAPATKDGHHAYVAGLLMHTVDMARMAEQIAAANPEGVNRDLLMAGTLLHDIGKAYAFRLSPATGLVSEITDQGRLLGHALLGANEIRACAKKGAPDDQISMVLQHMILACHNAGVTPAVLEAEILRQIHEINCESELYTAALSTTRPESFSEEVPALGKRVYNHGIVQWPSLEDCEQFERDEDEED